MEKPSNLIYGLNDKPPVGELIALGFQHVFILFISLIFPVIIVSELGNSISMDTARSFVSLTLIAGGISTILQAIGRGPVGSGYLCPEVAGPSYLPASIMAANMGGLPLLFGMTAFVGLVEVFFSRIMKKLRFLFPAEVTGLVIIMVGIVVVPMGIKNLLGISTGDNLVHTNEVITGLVTLMSMILINVFGKGKLRLYGVLIGMIIGYSMSYFLSIIPEKDINNILESPAFEFPYIRDMSWSFHPAMIIPFIVAALSSSLKTVGDIVTCQKTNDTNWKRPDMKSVSNGIFADGLGGLIPGLIGGFGQSTSSSNIGLSIATGATSRRIATAFGIIAISFAFFPKIANVFISMPKPVIGATLIFVISFIIIAGIQIISSRMMDARKTFVVGVSLIFGLSADIIPDVYKNIHPWIYPVFSSSLSLATVTAVILNLLLRIGISGQKTLISKVQLLTAKEIFSFFENHGKVWGAIPETINNAKFACNEVVELINTLELSDDIIKIKANYDEFFIKVNISYAGPVVSISTKKPSKEDLIFDPDALIKLGGFIINKYADKVETLSKNEKAYISLHFDQ